MKMMPMILIQTTCNKSGGKALFGEFLLAFRAVRKTWVAAEAAAKTQFFAVSNNVHNRASPLIVPDFIQV